MPLNRTLAARARLGSFALSGRRYSVFNKDQLMSKINDRKDGSRGSFAIMSKKRSDPFVAMNRP